MVKTSTLQIEQMAINAINDTITDKCPLLVADVLSNDKTPLLDGNILIYKSEDIKNENLIGNVPIQVKGTKKSITSHDISHKIQVNALQFYLRNGGVLYFVVVIDSKNHNNKQIYYSALSVVRLKNILSKIDPKQKSVTEKFYKFPTDTNRIMDVIHNFYENLIKQTSFASLETHPLEYWQKHPHFKNFSLHVTGYSNSKVPSAIELIESINSHDNNIYVELDNSPIQIPVSNEHFKIALCLEGEKPVKVGDVIYYEKVQIVRDEKFVKLQFGGAFTFTFDIETKKGINFQYVRPPKITLIQKALRFTHAMVSQKKCNIAGINIDSIDIGTQIAEIENQEKVLNEISNLLTTLHIEVDDIDYNSLSQLDFKYLQILHKCIIKHETTKELIVKGDFKDAIVGNIPIGNKSIRVLMWKDETGYKIEDFFNLGNKYLLLETEDGEYVPGTPYSTLNVDDFDKILNINYQNIISVYESIYQKSELVLSDAIEVLKILIKGYDKWKNEQFLQVAKEMQEWLQDKSSNEQNPFTNDLCRLEIVRRSRGLTSTEKQSLYQIINSQVKPIYKFSAFVLLEDYESANEIWNEETEESKEFIQAQPIYYLFEELQKLKVKT
ncbi:MAG: hypothetical protein ACI30J_02630 [Paludibacteraceae bacterium]